MGEGEIANAQLAVNIVAPVMAGKPREDIEVELRSWLQRRGGELPEPQYSYVVDAVAGGCRTVTLSSASQPPGGPATSPVRGDDLLLAP